MADDEPRSQQVPRFENTDDGLRSKFRPWPDSEIFRCVDTSLAGGCDPAGEGPAFDGTEPSECVGGCGVSRLGLSELHFISIAQFRRSRVPAILRNRHLARVLQCLLMGNSL